MPAVTIDPSSDPRISAVLFDLDGVLVDSVALIERVWRRWAVESGIDPDHLIARIHGRPAREVIEEFAPRLDADAEAERLDSWEMAHAAELSAVPGAMGCVALARRYHWAIVTSGLRTLALGRLEAIGLAVPDVFVTADDITHGKPDPEPYLLAAEQLGIGAPGCVVVEDSPAGVAAAKAAGMTAIGVSTTHAPAALAAADLVLGSMAAVHEELARLLG